MSELKRTVRVGNLPQVYSRPMNERVLRDALREVDLRFSCAADRLARVEEGLANVGLLPTGPERPKNPNRPNPTRPPNLNPQLTQGNGSGGRTTVAPPAALSVPTGRSTHAQSFPRASSQGRIPIEDEVIELRIAPDSTKDRWATATVSGEDFTGPGRIWQVQSVRTPRGFEQGRTSYRYRIVFDKMVFGVMSCRFLDTLSTHALDSGLQTGSRWEVRYGICIRGLPNYLGRQPSRATICYGANSPGGQVERYVLLSESWLTNNRTVFEERFSNDFDNGGKTTTTRAPSVVANGWMNADTDTPAYQQTIEGYSAMVVTGQTLRSAYAQVNGLESFNLPHVTGRIQGLASLQPQGVRGEPPTVSNWTAVASASDLVSRDSTTWTATDDVVEGVPFSYADVEALRPTDDKVSVFVIAEPARVLEWTDLSGGSGLFASPTDDMKPALWAESGLALDASAANREVSFDLILE